MVNVKKEPVPLRVVNLSHQERVINKGIELACCEIVKSVHTPGKNLNVQLAGVVENTHVDEKLLPHQKELYDRSI
jgi:hypothetical protein